MINIQAAFSLDRNPTQESAPLTQALNDAANAAFPGTLTVDQHVLSLAQGILESLGDAKAEDVLEIDLGGKTSIADTMVIATGRSNTHVSAIADRVLKACKSAGSIARVEGMPQCDWVLIDAGDMIVHIFRPEVRQFYNLEKMWGRYRPGERAGD